MAPHPLGCGRKRRRSLGQSGIHVDDGGVEEVGMGQHLDGLVGGERGGQGLDGKVVDRARVARLVWWISLAASSENRVSLRPASARWGRR